MVPYYASFEYSDFSSLFSVHFTAFDYVPSSAPLRSRSGLAVQCAKAS